MSSGCIFRIIPADKKAEHMAKDAEQPNQHIQDTMRDPSTPSPCGCIFRIIPTDKKAEHMAKDAKQPNQHIQDTMCDQEQEGIRSTGATTGHSKH
jgi:thiamine phosphate synthase YjbQ (UPF0047 family)